MIIMQPAYLKTQKMSELQVVFPMPHLLLGKIFFPLFKVLPLPLLSSADCHLALEAVVRRQWAVKPSSVRIVWQLCLPEQYCQFLTGEGREIVPQAARTKQCFDTNCRV
jgi:hypothetical protein